MKTMLLAMMVLVMTGCANEAANTTYDEPEELTDNEEIANEGQINDDADESEEDEAAGESAPDYEQLKQKVVEQFEMASPTVWGENIDGVVTELNTDDKVVALTFDACDGTPDSYDEELIDFLIEEQIPATLFINAQWIEENREVFTELADNPLFEIANHGYYHKPLSVSGESAYGIMGTENVEDVFDEIYKNQELIKEITNETPQYFRSGTAYYDDVAVDIIEELGLTAVNYNVLGDAGGTFNESQIVQAFGSAQEGSIFLFHMNKPHSDISNGVKEGVQMLREEGYEFVQLGEYDAHF
ncbi:peptidoglycan/xylan/chitin deacetylase (PgdA/CDA1 family) [Alkalibacterium olivapovliticus]|uniref:Peptidoglycan/xylan/chitin deacetylase (PgdA/CDA1 family) n=2 Tax=Alkalibacterium olivapovliticus TaxID=99907 RepID=A0A2T0W8V3_9LACT|nr:peptidoglycan/xylan/chitin deacetylase (PgdA/CDA1 family) [Alkalibacterium olivapovliticus]